MTTTTKPSGWVLTVEDGNALLSRRRYPTAEAAFKAARRVEEAGLFTCLVRVTDDNPHSLALWRVAH